MVLPKTVSSQAKIRFQDCDPFNHLNNGKYIDYFMNHREDELINAYDLDIYKMAKTEGKSWVSTSNQIVYLKPALLMEVVNIESQLIYFDNSNLKVEMRMYNEDKSHLKSIIWCGFTHYSLLTQKREIHSEDLMSFFGRVLHPTENQTFDKRIQNLFA
ncbi:MAG: acyl-CoA thioesterase [Winogradskyella sp.]|uniref:acyl-CoA thioesterase n=1 Tax=Winogradskyella sp. TaxID=1883156 RepID=UPI000F3E8B17|nr:acyl-CoA thioesterase [Winogradskyella sp.]RNC79818.1 MAG: acyl-CoA thioesterase [Winogradskyella sp.]